jgi:colanic acid/amylovoran biosynthesis glycosyltransferase
VTSLLDRGHEVDIYARRASGQTVLHADVGDYDLMPRTHFFNVPMSRGGRTIRATGILARNLLHHPGILLRCLNLPRYGSSYAILNNVMFVEPFLDRRYDAILCHFGGNGMDFVCLKDAFPNTRFVTMFHGDDYFIGDEKGPEAFALLKRLGDAFLVTTDCFGRATLRRYGFDDRRIVTLRLSIAAKKIPFRERWRTSDTVRLLSVGRLVEKKGLDFGVRAVAALQRANPDSGSSTVSLATDCSGRPSQARRAARRLRHSSAQHDWGRRNALDVRLDISLLPSLMEQAGYVLLEAQASGLLEVATRVGGVPEMVREGESALLVEAGNATAMTDALQELLNHSDRWSAMGQEGRRHVEEHFDVDRLTSQLEDVLKGTL